MTTTVLARARAGDGAAFRELTDPYRHELQMHCYRILGSVQAADAMLQETLLAAWSGLDGFEEPASLPAWLYKIATNQCLNALRDNGSRPAGSIAAVMRQPVSRANGPAARQVRQAGAASRPDQGLSRGRGADEQAGRPASARTGR